MVKNVLHLFLCIPQKCFCLKIHDLIVVYNIPLTQILLHKCHNNIAFTHWVRFTPLNTYGRRCSIMSTFIHTTKTPVSNFACIHTAPSHLQQSTNNCSLVYIILLFKIAIKTSPTTNYSICFWVFHAPPILQWHEISTQLPPNALESR